MAATKAAHQDTNQRNKREDAMSIEFKKQFFILLALFSFVLIMAAGAHAQTYTGSGVNMRSLQQNSCKPEALSLKVELLRLKQEVKQIIKCNAGGGFYQGGSCVDAVMTGHNFDEDAGPAPENRGGLEFSGSGIYGLIGGADGQPAQCVAVGCSFNGKDYEDGDKLTLYEQSDSCGAGCTSQTFTCNGDSFDKPIPSDAYASAGSCPAGPCGGCTHPFTGDAMDDGDSAMVYNPVRACGESCTSENIRCEDGTLQDAAWGSNYDQTCPDEPENCDECPHPVTGDMYPDGDTITLYKENNTCGTCGDKDFTCTSGTFGATTGYNHEDESSCLSANACPEGCDVYVGSSYQTTISDGDDVTYYKPSVGEANCGTCAGDTTKSCSNGDDINFTSAYDPTLGSETQCQAENPCPGSCTITWLDTGTSQTVDHGDDVTAHQTGSVAFGDSCNDQIRECDNGSLSGTYRYKNCAPEGASDCTSSLTGFIAHGDSVTQYKEDATCDNCSSKEFSCDDGTITPSTSPFGPNSDYTYSGESACLAANACPDPVDCTLNWTDGGSTIVPHNGDISAYANGSVAFGDSCTSQTRECNDGNLSGTYTYQNCAPEGLDVKAGCFVDTMLGDDVSNGNCMTPGACTNTDDINWSVGDYRQTGNGSIWRFSNLGAVDVQWTGDCVSSTGSCVSSLSNGTYSASVTVRENSTGSVIFTRTIQATKATTDCGDNTDIQ